MASQSAVEETRRCLHNIEQFDSLVNAYIVVIAESALKEAEYMTQRNVTRRLSPPLPGKRPGPVSDTFYRNQSSRSRCADRI